MPEQLSPNPLEITSPKKPEKPKAVVAEIDARAGLLYPARDLAERNLKEQLEKTTGLKRIILEIWKGNIFRELSLTKEINKVYYDIAKSGKENVYAGETEDRTFHQQAMATIVERFISEYDESLHQNAGEQKENLSDVGEEKYLKEDIQDLVREYAAGFISEEVFEKRKRATFAKLRGVKSNIINEGLVYADNLTEIAKEYRLAVEEGTRLHELDMDFEVVVGKAKTGVRTEAQYTNVDLLLEKIQQTPVGKLVNEYTLSTALSVAYCIAAKIGKDIGNSKLAVLSTLGASLVFSSFLAGANENKKNKEQRKQYLRERAKGQKFDSEKASGTEKEMEEFIYDARPAMGLIKNLKECIYEKNQTERPKAMTTEDFFLAVNNLAEIESRINISDSQKIDLIAYSDVKKVEQERFALDLTRAKTKQLLENHFSQDKENIAKTLGLENAQALGDFSQYLQKITNTINTEIMSGNEGVEKKNALFNQMKQKKVAIAAVRGLIASLVVGGAAEHISSGVNVLKPVEYLKKLLEGTSLAGITLLVGKAYSELGSWAEDNAFEAGKATAKKVQTKFTKAQTIPYYEKN